MATARPAGRGRIRRLCRGTSAAGPVDRPPLTVWFTWLVLPGVPALLLVIIWMRRYGGLIALPREHVPLRQRLQRLRNEMRARSVGEPAPPSAKAPGRVAPPPPPAPDPEPSVGPRFAAVGIPPDHAAQARIVSFEPESLAEHTEFLMAETRAFAGHADAFCAQADSLIHRPGVAPAVLRGSFKFADRFASRGLGRTGRPRAGTSTGSRPSRT